MPELSRYNETLSQARIRDLSRFSMSCGLAFDNLALLHIALTHKSYTNENRCPETREHNEKLEFFGDSVLGMVISEYLIKNFPDFNEGMLAKIKSSVVADKTLAEAAGSIGLGDFILLGRGEAIKNYTSATAVLENAFEALIGAYYLDRGLAPVSQFIIRIFADRIQNIAQNGVPSDYKSNLQEYVQKNCKEVPVYRIIKEEGPEHDRIFHVEVIIRNEIAGSGTGKSKKDAQQAAAQEAYKKIMGN
ncbi:MAG: ribonuclease III [Spirochaetes bacterium GWF1_41_5]|nr:MAG: ribonuclease III [Spirochaetes bacterium GWF1_41_5]HBE01202.1 ribonuclease III [Spirochaetia bacterium]